MTQLPPASNSAVCKAVSPAAKRSTLPAAEYFFEHPPWNNVWMLFSVALLVSCFDFLAGPIVFFPILFLIPVSLMAWNSEMKKALWLGAILCAIRFTTQYLAWGVPYTFTVALINAVLRMAVLFVMVFLCSKLAQTIRALRARVRTLEGILPTCGFCKDIRDEEGNWHQIESYVASRSEAKFSHGVCPTCAVEHYGDVLSKSRKNVGAGA